MLRVGCVMSRWSGWSQKEGQKKERFDDVLRPYFLARSGQRCIDTQRSARRRACRAPRILCPRNSIPRAIVVRIRVRLEVPVGVDVGPDEARRRHRHVRDVVLHQFLRALAVLVHLKVHVLLVLLNVWTTEHDHSDVQEKSGSK